MTDTTLHAPGTARRPLHPFRTLLLVGWAFGFVNSLVHAKDAAATLPEGLMLAVLVFALVAVASVLELATGGPEVRT